MRSHILVMSAICSSTVTMQQLSMMATFYYMWYIHVHTCCVARYIGIMRSIEAAMQCVHRSYMENITLL